MSIRTINDLQAHLIDNGFVVKERLRESPRGQNRNVVEVLAYRTCSVAGHRVLHRVFERSEGGWMVTTMIVLPGTDIDKVIGYEETHRGHRWCGTHFDTVFHGAVTYYVLGTRQPFSKTRACEYIVSTLPEDYGKVIRGCLNDAEDSLKREEEYLAKHRKDIKEKKAAVIAVKALMGVKFAVSKVGCSICGAKYDPNDSHNDMTMCRRCGLLAHTCRNTPELLSNIWELVASGKKRKKRVKIERTKVSKPKPKAVVESKKKGK